MQVENYKNGIVYGYDTAKKKVVFLRANLEVIYYEGHWTSHNWHPTSARVARFLSTI